MDTPSYGQTVLSGFINLLIVVAALVVLYYSFKFFYGTSTEQGVTAISSKMVANKGAQTFTGQTIARMYEGGEYTVNFWMYIGGWKQNQGTRKHVLEIGGPNFSTLLIALGAFKNSLSVRVHTQNIPGLTDASGNDASGNRAGSAVSVSGMAANLQETSLSVAEKNNFFKPLTMDDGLLNVAPSCDIESIDLQRWVQVTVVLNGRTCDVYVDGKLARSCVLRNFYRVDPSFSGMTVTERGGFDGYLSQVSTYNYSLTPDVIYKMYMAGPTGTSMDPFAYLVSLFQKQQ